MRTKNSPPSRCFFACGDVRFSPVKRVASAVGEGSMAIAFVHQYLQRCAAAPAPAAAATH
jgi:thioredoxin reductase (NADPH)